MTFKVSGIPLPFILPFLVALLLPGDQHVHTQPAILPDPVSSWLYPSSTPEATRNNRAKTNSQQASDLVIKWMNSQLKDSPVLLVGAIRTEDGIRQQVIGAQRNGTAITILNSRGFLDTTFSAATYSNGVTRVQLTGLFNTADSSATPTGRPNVLGVGVEGMVSSNVFPRAFLIDGQGNLRYLIGLTQSDYDSLALNTAPENRMVSIYPIGAWKPTGTDTVAYALFSQERFVRNSHDASVVNGLRKFRLTPEDERKARQIGTPFPIAPKTYGSVPALHFTGGTIHQVAVGTERYAFDPPITVLPGSNERSSTDTASLMHLELNTSTDFPRISSVKYDARAAQSVRSFFVTLQNDRTPSNPIVAEPSIVVADRLTRGTSPAPRLEVLVESGNQSRYNVSGTSDYSGWNIIPADLDGTAAGNVSNQFLVNNPGVEIIAAETNPLNPARESLNLIYRANTRAASIISNTPVFHPFTEHSLPGRIVAAGDLVADSNFRQEVILVHDDTLKILQMRSYDDDLKFRNAVQSQRQPFLVLKAFALGDSILSVAIADLEGDGENDILAATKAGTFCIGKLQPDPFPVELGSPQSEFCLSDSIFLSWSRNTQGGGAGLIVTLIGNGREIPIKGETITNDTLRATPSALAVVNGGEYRLVVSDNTYRYISDTSDSFVFRQASISALNFTDAFTATPGTRLTDTLEVSCLDNLLLQIDPGTGVWTTISSEQQTIDERRRTVSTTVPCPADLSCLSPDRNTTLRYRMIAVSAAGDTLRTNEESLDVAEEVVPLTIEPVRGSDSSRTTVVWPTDAYTCSTVTFTAVSPIDGTSIELGTTSSGSGRFSFRVPPSMMDSIIICGRCVDGGSCRRGIVGFRSPEIDQGSYVAPNPFNPLARAGDDPGAVIVFTLATESRVTVEIYDAGLVPVKRITENEVMIPGRKRLFWDGRNESGHIVANGTYICVILRNDEKQIILPITVVKRP